MHSAHFDQVKCVKIRTILCIDSVEAECRCALWTVAVTQRSADSLCELCSAAHVPARLSGLMGLDREGVYDTDIYIARGSTGKAVAALLCHQASGKEKKNRFSFLNSNVTSKYFLRRVILNEMKK